MEKEISDKDLIISAITLCIIGIIAIILMNKQGWYILECSTCKLIGTKDCPFNTMKDKKYLTGCNKEEVKK